MSSRGTSRWDGWIEHAHGFFIALSALIGLGPWWPLFGRARGLFPSIVAIHRSAGDIQYFPLVAGLADLNFGENMVLEEFGRHIKSFPFAAILLHAFCVRLLGDYGWLAADAAVSIGYYLLGRSLLIRAGVPARWASLFSITLLFTCFTDALGFLHAKGLHIDSVPEPDPRVAALAAADAEAVRD